MPENEIAEMVIRRIAEAAEAIAFQAGVGGMETAGSIVSYLAEHPEDVPALMAGKLSVLDWPIGWHMHGRLTWHGQDGRVFSPEYARRQTLINQLERGGSDA